MVMTTLILVLLFIAGFISVLSSLTSSKLHAWLPSFLTGRSTPSVPGDTTTVPQDSSKDTEAGEKAELKSLFATFDKNGDGFITKQELTESLRNIRILLTDKDVEEMVAKVDSNGDGLIDFDEFCVLCEAIGGGHYRDQDLGQMMSWGDGKGSGVVEGDGERDLMEAFDVFDVDKDGLISVEELNLVMSSLGLKEGKRMEDCIEMIRKVDVDGDGMVNFDEFKRMMMMR
uniref:Calcium-binding family protein n=1 Tax=Rhizophora mucronata TaxID=61149 RepID=A0A2P2Q3P3_RHIMU